MLVLNMSSMMLQNITNLLPHFSNTLTQEATLSRLDLQFMGVPSQEMFYPFFHRITKLSKPLIAVLKMHYMILASLSPAVAATIWEKMWGIGLQYIYGW